TRRRKGPNSASRAHSRGGWRSMPAIRTSARATLRPTCGCSAAPRTRPAWGSAMAWGRAEPHPSWPSMRAIATTTIIRLFRSGGKDSALARQEVLRDQRYRVVALVTTVTTGYERISMHGVRRTLLHRQARALGLRLDEVLISPHASNEEYERQMAATLTAARARCAGLDALVFGDLFLADIRAYRERMLARIGMRGLFRLWLRDTRELAA